MQVPLPLRCGIGKDGNLLFLLVCKKDYQQYNVRALATWTK